VAWHQAVGWNTVRDSLARRKGAIVKKPAATETAKVKKGFASISVSSGGDIARTGGTSVRFENREFSKQKKLAHRAEKKGGRNPGARRGERSYSDAASRDELWSEWV